MTARGGDVAAAVAPAFGLDDRVGANRERAHRAHLDGHGVQARAAVGSVFGNWPAIVGPQVAAHTTPESFDNGELTVTADSDTWATQLRLLAPQILTRLAEELGAGTVHHLRVRGPSTRKRGNVRPR